MSNQPETAMRIVTHVCQNSVPLSMHKRAIWKSSATSKHRMHTHTRDETYETWHPLRLHPVRMGNLLIVLTTIRMTNLTE